MAKIRIGKNVGIRWRITTNGEDVPLEGRNLTLFIRHPYMQQKQLDMRVVDGNVVAAVFRGVEQHYVGVYTLTLYEDYGLDTQNITDRCDAFELVRCSCEELTTGDLSTTDIEVLVSDYIAGVEGLSAYEVAVKNGFVGSEAEWLDSLVLPAEQAAEETRQLITKVTEAENERTASEETRQINESTREQQETSRAAAEEVRVQAETKRVQAEQQRADEFAGFTATLAAKEDAANKVTTITADADDTHYPSAKAVKTAITKLADGEDLASVGDALKLADKAYTPSAYSGMGRKYLRKNLVSGKNILTQAMLPSANTIYIIQYDYDLNGTTVNVPANCTLDFQGGSLGNGTVELNNALLIGNIKMFANFTKIKNPKVCLSWFINSNTPSVISDTIDRVMSECEGKIIEIDKSIIIARTIVVPCNTSIKGITMQLGTFVYPSKEFVGQYVFDFEGDNIDGGWVYRSDISNLWINLSLYKGDGDLSAIFHINKAYSLNISNIRIDNMKVPLSGFLLSNITTIRLDNCSISGVYNTSGKYGIDCIDNIYSLDAISIDVENFPRGIVVSGKSNINLVNLYAERCNTTVFSNNLAKNGNITINGGVILIPSSSSHGCSFTIIEDNGTINIIGVKFRADNGGTGVYLDGREDYMGNVNIVGVEDKYISIYRGGKLTKLNAPNIRGAKNIYALSGRVTLQNLKKKVIGRISYSAEDVRGGGLIRIWAAANIAEDSVYHYVKKTFQFNTYASTIYLKEIEEPIIGHANNYNFNAYINIVCDKYYRSSDRVNGIAVSLETKFTGGLVSDTSGMLVSYNVEVVSLFYDNVIYLEEDSSDATSIESFTPELYNKKGASSSRPSNVREGFFYFDTTLNKPIWWNGSAWVDSTGAVV